jgi:hypothetical protein
MSNEGLFRTSYVQGVYIPSALLIVGTAIMKSEWVPYAIGLAAILGGWKVYSNGSFYQFNVMCMSDGSSSPQGAQAERVPGV